MEPGNANSDESPSFDELYNINLFPSELFLKFRNEIQGLRVGVNLEVSLSPKDVRLLYLFMLYICIFCLHVCMFVFGSCQWLCARLFFF